MWSSCSATSRSGTGDDLNGPVPMPWTLRAAAAGEAGEATVEPPPWPTALDRSTATVWPVAAWPSPAPAVWSARRWKASRSELVAVTGWKQAKKCSPGLDGQVTAVPPGAGGGGRHVRTGARPGAR